MPDSYAAPVLHADGRPGGAVGAAAGAADARAALQLMALGPSVDPTPEPANESAGEGGTAPATCRHKWCVFWEPSVKPVFQLIDFLFRTV